ncbi:hypothetical protein [Weissella paramesenteroides]|uniref:DUF1642 domain-containing protein n=1 Tax=Weissella paramesenteroides ATCC 33313 TaxID=585506 RepID=C5R807_WEIPA|nr:hypothetical protein [Weissella paramesenteroides]EER75591.1 hypothetical protein HMPREF0877_0102 [Weissella paramesenteroides ATCC 33313]
MTDKAYIVVNEEQEHEVLEQFENQGYIWFGGGEKPTEWTPTSKVALGAFPYALLDDGELSWCYMSQLDNQKIVYDGRKESKMKISKEVYYALVEWRDNHELQTTFISGSDLFHFPHKIVEWVKDTNTLFDNRNRLIAILQWLNNKDIFEVEKPKKWVVRSKETDLDNNRLYVEIENHETLKYDVPTLAQDVPENATKFDTKEEAESWANAHQEVVEVEG